MSDSYKAGKCPECGEFAIGTYRHPNAPVYCINKHEWMRPPIAKRLLGHREEYENKLKDRIKELEQENDRLEEVAQRRREDRNLALKQVREMEKEKAELIEWLEQTHKFRDDVLIRTVINRIKGGEENE